jgi:hypothetical protein
MPLFTLAGSGGHPYPMVTFFHLFPLCNILGLSFVSDGITIHT